MNSQQEKKFIEGLKKYKISKKDIEDGILIYAGSNCDNNGIKYYKRMFNNKDFPPKVYNCICGQEIVNNHYITNKKKTIIIVLGCICIKKFLPNGTSKTCEKCMKTHKNRIVNRCNNCRYGLCDICNIEIDNKYHKCSNCDNSIYKNNIIHYCSLCNSKHLNNFINRCDNCRIGLCDECDDDIDEDNYYSKCYFCYNKNKIQWLKIPFKNKDNAKKLGARWCNTKSKKSWYTNINNENLPDLLKLCYK